MSSYACWRPGGSLRAPALVGFILLLGLLVTLPQQIYAQGTPGDIATCVGDAYGANVNCTANDVQLSLLIVEDAESVVCEYNEAELRFEAEVQMKAQLRATAAERYDIGIFIAEDGGDAINGECHRNYLPPPLARDGTCSISGDVCQKDDDCLPDGGT